MTKYGTNFQFFQVLVFFASIESFISSAGFNLPDDRLSPSAFTEGATMQTLVSNAQPQSSYARPQSLYSNAPNFLVHSHISDVPKAKPVSRNIEIADSKLSCLYQRLRTVGIAVRMKLTHNVAFIAKKVQGGPLIQSRDKVPMKI